jgi:hypothetical protein
MRYLFDVLVDKVRFEPTQPGVADLQSAATLQLRRLSIYKITTLSSYAVNIQFIDLLL